MTNFALIDKQSAKPMLASFLGHEQVTEIGSQPLFAIGVLPGEECPGFECVKCTRDGLQGEINKRQETAVTGLDAAQDMAHNCWCEKFRQEKAHNFLAQLPPLQVIATRT